MSKRRIKVALIFALGLLLALYLIYGGFNFGNKNDYSRPKDGQEKLLIVSSLFPWYDLAKQIGGERVDSVLLLPPGLEAHSYEPKPQDLLNISQADLFIYTNAEMEPWASDIFMSLNRVKAVLSMGEDLTEMELGHKDNEDEHQHLNDPHIWLDPVIMKTLTLRLERTLVSLDPEAEDYYHNNAVKYLNSLDSLDSEFKSGLENCETREIVYAGHYAFGYLAHRYNLEYLAAQGNSPNAESTPARLVELSQALKNSNSVYVFKDNLEGSQLAESLAKQNNIEILTLKTGANVSLDDYNTHLSYEELMKYNLEQLIKGLKCQK